MPTYRTTEQAVRDLLGGEVPVGVDLTPWLQSANVIVTARCLTAGYSTEMLELIERYLAAHLYMMNQRVLVRRKIGQSEDEWDRGKVGLGLDLTPWGQMIKTLLDPKNTLGFKAKLKVVWLGTEDPHPYLREN